MTVTLPPEVSDLQGSRGLGWSRRVPASLRRDTSSLLQHRSLCRGDGEGQLHSSERQMMLDKQSASVGSIWHLAKGRHSRKCPAKR